MIPGSFDYVTATSLPEAVTLLEQHGDDAKPSHQRKASNGRLAYGFGSLDGYIRQHL